jgi:hypothetical protein
MDKTVIAYLGYLAITVPLTIWVARALYHHGGVFLIDVFRGNEALARAVNNLLVIGFYLLNLGYVAFFLKAGHVDTTTGLIETMAKKVGGVSIVLGLVHLGNVWAFNTFRKRAVREAAGLPPVRPDARINLGGEWLPPTA